MHDTQTETTTETDDTRSSCPKCGGTCLDGRGAFRREFERVRPSGDDEPHPTHEKVVQRWFELGCTECGETFATLEVEATEEFQTPDTGGDH